MGIKDTWIAVDVDGVLAASVEHLLTYATKLAPQETPEVRSDVKSFRHKIYGVLDVFHTLYCLQSISPTFVLETPPIDGAAKALQDLSEHYRIAIVTARPTQAEKSTRAWLDFWDIPFEAYHTRNGGDKHLTDPPTQWLIDDSPDNIRDYLEKTEGTQGVLFLQPWNVSVASMPDPRCTVAAHWDEVSRLLLKMG